jgi:hypothetical protein
MSRLSPSLASACNLLLQAHPPWAQDNTSRGSLPPPLVFHLASTHLGWDTQRQFTRRSRDPPGSKRRQNLKHNYKSGLALEINSSPKERAKTNHKQMERMIR